MCTNQVDCQHYHHKPLSCLQVDPTELRQVANIQQIFIRHCTTRRSSIQLSCNCRAVLIAKGEEHHKRRSGHIATDKSNTLYDKNRIVCFITILCKSLMRCTLFDEPYYLVNLETASLHDTSQQSGLVCHIFDRFYQTLYHTYARGHKTCIDQMVFLFQTCNDLLSFHRYYHCILSFSLFLNDIFLLHEQCLENQQFFKLLFVNPG